MHGFSCSDNFGLTNVGYLYIVIVSCLYLIKSILSQNADQIMDYLKIYTFDLSLDLPYLTI